MSNHYKNSSDGSNNYWSKWPTGGKYIEDLTWGAKISIEYLKAYTKRKKPTSNSAVIFDVDETLIFGDPEEKLGVREMELGEHNGQPVFILPPNPPIVKILNFAKKIGYKIIILTARPAASKMATITNLDMFHIPYDFIIMNNKDQDPEFKILARRKLAKKFDIVLTVGDQPCDVLLPGKSAVLKLPSEESKCAYFHPNS
jgi:hypothetical protein